jgi:hypothetical protein
MHKKNKVLSVLGIFLVVSAIVSFIVFYFTVMASQQGYHYIDPETLELVQTEEIPEGAPIAVIKTSLGPPSSRISSRIPASRPGRPML